MANKNPKYETSAEQHVRLGFHFTDLPRATFTSAWLIHLTLAERRQEREAQQVRASRYSA